MAALAAVLGTTLLFCASASAKLAQTITFTSTTPSGAVAGGSYTVSATDTSGMVLLSADGACSLSKPLANEKERLEREVIEKQPAITPRPSPEAVYFTGAGTCTIDASGIGDSEYESPPNLWQSFPVAKDPSEQITFTSLPPSNAAVGGSYNPEVRLSAGIQVSFFTTTPSVCRIAPRHAAVNLVGVGTCTIGVRQNGVSESEPPEAKQAFKVYATTSESKKTATKAKKHRKAKKCKKSQVRRNGKCVKKRASPPSTTTPTTTSPEATGTIVIKLISGLQPPPGLAEGPAYGTREVRVTRLGPGANTSFATWEQTVHGKETLQVPPGEYEVWEEGFSRKVIVAAGQSQEVTLETEP